ncbi:DNA alkylation repair protein [Nesterenkonia haasae]|uniref:DNA alkylation repair protein n=1 Tax=Nesterenkonia haasae TaxID=2587813 RepID=UPI001390A156|nr:DNA alkylation repair protein [Nesterenkonia haasae]NDK30281.1 DNA alkylation repair protein [Nesterenkonia haasae]
MATVAQQITTALTGLCSESEQAKITRRLPAESGLSALGVRMKDVFDLAKAWTGISLTVVPDLLASQWYEVRMVAVAILDFKARRRGLGDGDRRHLYDTYLKHHHLLTVWDLVDRAAPRVVGWYLSDKSREPLFSLAESEVALERRTAITAAFWLIRQGDTDDPLELAVRLIEDDSELVTKPVGTALREVGKVDPDRLLTFLIDQHHRMPRAMIRTATDSLPDNVRREWLRQR